MCRAVKILEAIAYNSDSVTVRLNNNLPNLAFSSPGPNGVMVSPFEITCTVTGPSEELGALRSVGLTSAAVTANSTILSRELLYTALTRSRQKPVLLTASR